MANVMKHHFNGDCHDSFDHAAGDSHDANHDEDFNTNVEWYRRGISSGMSIIASMQNIFEFAFPTSLYKNVISIDSHRAAALFKNAMGILGIMGPLRKRYLCVTSRERMRPTPELRDTRLTFDFLNWYKNVH